MLPDSAVIVVDPAVTAVASPIEPAALLIVATPVLVELQVTAVVKSCVVLSEKVPMAVNCCIAPLAIEELLGTTAMDVSVADVTVWVFDRDIPPNVAVIVVEPGPAA